ncbi:MAG: phosphate signaling complex protein PhoU [Caldilineaceae bacterium]|nr:phosphate signaling complex protein PhoU [Caldilineaceae bacterium]
MRTEFNRALNDLRDDILLMASRVEHELDAALTALADVDIEKAREVYAADRIVNQNRFDIEDRCFALIATQQPAAGDLRLVVAAMSMVVDIERMGDQAKGIAKVVTHLYERTTIPRPPELVEMGKMVRDMLRRAMQAYAEGNIVLAQTVANTDEDVDHLYGQVFAQMMDYMAAHDSPDEVEAGYEILRSARELERFGDLVTNVAERTIYLVTGSMSELNVEHQPRAFKAGARGQ